MLSLLHKTTQSTLDDRSGFGENGAHKFNPRRRQSFPSNKRHFDAKNLLQSKLFIKIGDVHGMIKLHRET